MHSYSLSDLKYFLKSAEIFEKVPVIFFVDTTGTSLVPSFLYQVVRTYHVACRVRDINSNENEMLVAELASTVLGERVCYILAGIQERLKKNTIPSLATYRGPHSIFCIVPELLPSLTVPVVTISTIIAPAQFLELNNLLFNEELTSLTPFMQQVFNRYKHISFQAAYALLSYQRCVPATDALFFDQWIEEIVVPEHSLFELSSAFFAKNCASALRLWHTIKDGYGAHFWPVYWSEQLFRAVVYRSLKEQQVSIPPAVSYRLPFSFIQRDWRISTLPDLVRAHDLLYTFDQRLKLGGTALFELLIATYCTK
jgi:hypothetical protein